MSEEHFKLWLTGNSRITVLLPKAGLVNNYLFSSLWLLLLLLLLVLLTCFTRFL